MQKVNKETKVLTETTVKGEREVITALLEQEGPWVAQDLQGEEENLVQLEILGAKEMKGPQEMLAPEVPMETLVREVLEGKQEQKERRETRGSRDSKDQRAEMACLE